MGLVDASFGGGGLTAAVLIKLVLDEQIVVFDLKDTKFEFEKGHQVLDAIATCLNQLISLQPPQLNNMELGKLQIECNNIKLELGLTHLDNALPCIIANETHILPENLPFLGQQVLAGDGDGSTLLHQLLVPGVVHEASLGGGLRRVLD